MWISDKIEDMIDNAKARADSNKPLTKFSYHYGGNMCGNSHNEVVAPYDESHARISVSHADWHHEDPKVSEYLVDIGIMKKIEEIFHKYSMEKWNGKKFTDMFVCDGESYGYSFDFDKSYISFSSQIYPKKYYEKLNEIHEVLKEYIEKGEKLPGLCPAEISEEEQYKRYRPEDGKISIEVFSYFCGKLSFRVFNGTGENIEVPTDKKLFREGEAEPFVKEVDRYPNTVYANRCEEESIKVPACLEAGSYRLQAGELECSFEIKQDV